jgi:hypothetical protein
MILAIWILFGLMNACFFTAWVLTVIKVVKDRREIYGRFWWHG